MDRVTAEKRLGAMYGQAYVGHDRLYSEGPTIGIDPATIAMLIQLLAYLLPKILERCDVTPEQLHVRANKRIRTLHRRLLIADIRQKIGWFKSWWYDVDKLADAAIRVAADRQSVPLMQTLAK